MKVQGEANQLFKTLEAQTAELSRKAMEIKETQFHLFMGASIIRYAAVLYAAGRQNDQLQTDLIFYKRRPMLIKWSTVTKVVLLVAFFGVRALIFVRKEPAIQLALFRLMSSHVRIILVISLKTEHIPCLQKTGF